MKKSDNIPEWLFMVYMAANDSDDLDSLAVQDLLEMQRALAVNPHVEVWAQVHRRWPSAPQRYHIRQKDAEQQRLKPPSARQERRDVDVALVEQVTRLGIEASLKARLRPSFYSEVGEEVKRTLAPKPKLAQAVVGSGEGRTLLEFLCSAPEAKHYCLVLWGHAFGLGFGRDHGDPLTLTEISHALKGFQHSKPPTNGPKRRTPARNSGAKRRVHILGGNTCTLSYVEAIYQFRDAADYLVASQVAVPFAGWPYESILRNVRPQDPEIEVQAAERVGRLIVEQYSDFYSSPDRDELTSMTLVDLSKAGGFKQELSKLAKWMEDAANDATRPDFISRLRDAFLVNPASEIRPLLDLTALTAELKNVIGTEPSRDGSRATLLATKSSAKDGQRDPADSMCAALSAAIVTPRQGTSSDGRKGLVSEVGKSPDAATGNQSPALTGVSVFAPFVVNRRLRMGLELEAAAETDDSQDAQHPRRMHQQYERLDIFHGDKSWPRVVNSLLLFDEPDEVVDSLGEIRTADLSDISLLTLGVDASFRCLYREQKAVCTTLLEALKTRPKAGDEQLRAFGAPTLRLRSMTNLRLRQRSSNSGGPAAEPGTSIAHALGRLERAVSTVEAMVRAALLDWRFGIGPLETDAVTADITAAHSGSRLAGPGFASRPVKTAGPGFMKTVGPGFMKTAGPGFVKSVGPGEGVLTDVGSQLVFATANHDLVSLAVEELFGQVAGALGALEQSCEAIELLFEQLLNRRALGSQLIDPEYRNSVQSLVTGAFRDLKDVTDQVQHTIRSVAFHPSYGIGPGPLGLRRKEREALAFKAGFSRRALRLL